MNAFHLAGLLFVVGLILTAWHFVRMSDAMRANDAEGRSAGPAFRAFLSALGCAAAAGAIGGWLLFVAGWLAITAGAAGSFCAFASIISYHANKTVPSWARFTVLLSVAVFLVSMVAALIRAVT